MAERGCGLAVASEPWFVPPDAQNWAAATDRGTVAVTWRHVEGSPTCERVEAGPFYVAVAWGGLRVVGVYLSPNKKIDRAEFRRRLGTVAGCVRRCHPHPTLVLGDFNAWSRAWGSKRTSWRGREVHAWAGRLGLRLLNVGFASTLVRTGGESIVDLSWATPSAAGLTTGWKVLEGETASDHLHIEMAVAVAPPRAQAGTERGERRRRRWAMSKIDKDKFRAAVAAGTWSLSATQAEGPLEERVGRLVAVLTDACDASMPRVSKPRARRAMPWWTEEIAQLRASATGARKRVSGLRRRRGERESATPLERRAVRRYRGVKKALVGAIAREKGRAHKELLQSLNQDPWGRPYRMVLNKLRPWAPPVTETMDPALLQRVVGTLFPPDGDERVAGSGATLPPPPTGWREEMEVSAEELGEAVRRIKGGKAPGPDGIPGAALAMASRELGDHIRQIYTACLREGKFPGAWKAAEMVLLPKPGKPLDSPSAYRPICLLDEAGKLLERILVARLVRHLDGGEGPNLCGGQYGFRPGRSTVDAILRVRALAEPVLQRGGVVLLVSLDISNAFNSLPWRIVRGALKYFGVPLYLRRVLSDYFSGRTLTYTDPGGVRVEREIERGVPQGSVLGPFLWNLAFDKVVRTTLPPGSSVVCYADDTLVLSGGANWEQAARAAEVAVDRVVRAIRSTGLRVAAQKTEAIFLRPPRKRRPPETKIRVDGTNVVVGTEMKYLGLRLDGAWGFAEHFARLAPRLQVMAASLSRLLPRTGGPGWRARRLYAGVLASVALYGSPIWAERAMNPAGNRAHLRRARRLIALRVIRAYRTVGHAAAGALAGLPPLELLAAFYAAMYRRTLELRRRVEEGEIDPSDLNARIEEARREEWRALIGKWARQLEETPGRVTDAIRPYLGQWVGVAGKWSSPHAVQILSGHGCFGRYLCRIGSEATPRCHECGADQDDAQHTLEHCPRWREERVVLVGEIGADLSPRAIFKALVQGGEEKWKAFSSFCSTVMQRKEENERERIRAGERPGRGNNCPALRGRRRGRGGGGRGGGGRARDKGPRRPPGLSSLPVRRGRAVDRPSPPTRGGTAGGGSAAPATPPIRDGAVAGPRLRYPLPRGSRPRRGLPAAGRGDG